MEPICIPPFDTDASTRLRTVAKWLVEQRDSLPAARGWQPTHKTVQLGMVPHSAGNSNLMASAGYMLDTANPDLPYPSGPITAGTTQFNIHQSPEGYLLRLRRRLDSSDVVFSTIVLKLVKETKPADQYRPEQPAGTTEKYFLSEWNGAETTERLCVPAVTFSAVQSLWSKLSLNMFDPFDL